MKKLIAAIFLLALTTTSGCATIESKLPAIVAAVTDGVLILDSIEAFAKTYFILHPDNGKQQTVSTAIARAKGALDAALRIVDGYEKIDQAKIDEAFADFKVAYTDLLAIVSSIGVKTSGDRMLASTGGGLVVPPPLALKLK